MNRRRYASYLSLLYVSALLLLLGLLAVLQYQWTGEASLAEQQRMRQGLQQSLLYIQREFDTEISRVVEAYWQPPRSAENLSADWPTELSRALQEANRQWRASATDPRLISRVLVADNPDNQPPALLAFDGENNRLEPTDWPEALSEFRRSFLSGPRFTEPTGRRAPGNTGILPWYSFLDEVPALVSVLVFRSSPRTESRENEMRERSPREEGRCQICLILCLDADYVFREWIPALAERHLSTAASGGYDFIVRSGREPGSIFCSSPDADAVGIVAQPDAVANLMGFRREQPRRREPLIQGGGGRAEQPDERAVDTTNAPAARRRRPAPGPADLPVSVPPDEDRASLERAIERRQQIPRITEMLADQGWQLLVKHRAGSLDAVVGRTRIRNLAISLGILLLLAVSLVVLSVTVLRARRLAKQQMEFVAGVSHELRTPIAVICSTAENLADGLITGPGQVSQYGTFILREGRRLGTLVEQTLAYAGIESAQLTLRTQPLDLAELVSRVVQDLRRESSAKKIEIGHTAANGSTQIEGDPTSLDTAVRNLVENAIKYSRPGTTVHVTVGKSRSGDTVEVVVSDEGIGIETADISRLFDPFYRGSNAIRAQIRGAGIGLSLVKRIVDAHRGTIEVKSKVSEGSTFTVAFPALRESEPTGGDLSAERD